MKEIWKKTSLLYKIIAVLLTVVMVGTTMYFHFEKKYVAKAEGITLEVYKAYLPTGNDNSSFGDGGWITVNDGKVANAEGRKFAYIIDVYGDANIATVKLSKDNGLSYNDDLSMIPGSDYKRIVCEVDFNNSDATSYKLKFFDSSSQQIGEERSIATSETAFQWEAADSITIKSAIINNNDTSVNLENADVDLKNGATVVVTATAPVNDASFSTLAGITPTLEISEKDAQTQLFTYTATYIFNGTENANFTGEDVKVTVTKDTYASVNVSATKLSYDKTPPTVDLTLGVENYVENKWYGSATAPVTTAKFTIKSGSNVTYESNFNTITIGSENKTNSSVNTITINDIDVSEGANSIAVYAKDNAGNELPTQTYTFNIDNTIPVVSSFSVGNQNTDGSFVTHTSGSITLSGTTSDVCANNEVGSGVNNVHITVKKPDNSVKGNIDVTPAADGSFTADLGAIIGTLEDNNGIYNFEVYATDNVGNTSNVYYLNSITIDTIDPLLNIVAFEQYNTANGAWVTIDSNDISDSGVYYVNKEIYSKIRYTISLTEKNPLDSNPVKAYNGDVLYGDFIYSGSETIYCLEIDTSSLDKDSSLALTAKTEDKASNVGNYLMLTPLQLVDSAIKVNLTGLTIGENSVTRENVEDIGSLITNKNVKDKVTIKVVAKSGFDITEVTLTNGSDFTKTATLSPITPDAEGIYTTNEITFVIPEETLNNTQISALNLYVKDGTNPDKVIPVGDLLYDNTDPEITITNSDYNSTKWYQEYRLQYNLVSGESAIESDLASASYTINGTVNDVAVSGTKIENASTNDIPESTSVAGTTVSFAAEDKATNSLNGGVFVVKVDKTNPTVADIKVNGEAVSGATVIAGTPQLTSNITDNLTVKDYSVSVKYNDEMYVEDYHVSVEKDASQESISHTLQQVLGSKELKDGKYTVSISASDKSGRTSNVASTTFIVDNTVPVLGASIISGTSGKSNGYYNTDVVVRLTCTDNNFNPAAMSVTDNGSAVNVNWQVGNDMYYADVTLSSEGLHDIRVSGNDKAGTSAQAKQVTFTIDKTVPTVSLLVNGGQIYNESRGTLNLTGPLTFTASVSDTNEDAGDLRVQVIKTVPDTATTTSEFLPTGERTFTFADEADYVINIFAIDKANNQGPTRTISFRVDTTAPQLTITGAGGTAASATSVSFNITEAFWSDAKGTVEIYRKAGDGVDEALYKTLTISPTQRAYSLSELLRESGIYRFEFTADDKVGHTATTSQKITVDVNKPEITLSGVNNYDSTDGAVSISAIIKDEFYASKKVSIQGTRTDAAGKKTALSFSPFAATANPTTINDTFSEEGIYDITLTATDIAGNVTSNSVHFTIDTSDPVIGDLSMYDGKTFNAKSFEDIGLDIDLDEIVSDLTVCQVRMYLNGSEYDGISEIEDGSYTLLITAEDELGHTSEKSATFVLDTKEPIFIVTGVEDGEVRNDSYSIEVSLQLDEDTLEEVKLNDTVITVKNNVASLSVSDKGEYKLYMKATDEAGNEAEQTITFTFGEEQKSVTTAVSDAVEKAASHWWIWAIVVAAILAVGGLIFFILKRRKED